MTKNTHLPYWLLITSAFAAACDGGDTEARGEQPEFRQGISIDASPPAANAPVVATLVPGAPFAFGDRYAYARAPGVAPNMARFAPAHVDSIPRLVSGDIVAVQRGGQVSRARLVGFDDESNVVFRPQAGSPFTHAFSAIPWSAWGAQSGAMSSCAEAVDDEWLSCVEAVGEGSWCSAAGDSELDDCASGQDYAVAVEFGGVMHFDFACLLIAPHSATIMGEPMNVNGCDGEFWGTMTQEPGFWGCENIYNGIWAGGPACGNTTIILDDVPG
jgi:hypothetical protein